jgi:hypothetical protein
MASIIKTAQDRLSAVAQNLTGGLVGSEHNFPAFDELPKVNGMPQGSIWGFYDKNGKKDEVGGMSHLCPFLCTLRSQVLKQQQP